MCALEVPLQRPYETVYAVRKENQEGREKAGSLLFIQYNSLLKNNQLEKL
jgi:hypothetical protein